MSQTSLIAARLVEPWWIYTALALAGSLVVRLVSCTLRASETPKIWNNFRTYFRGFGANPSDINDYWHPYLLGALELWIYPFLIIVNKPEYIGAWIALKTLPQWKLWIEQRNTYNRFLIGNALVLVFSYVLSQCCLASR